MSRTLRASSSRCRSKIRVVVSALDDPSLRRTDGKSSVSHTTCYYGLFFYWPPTFTIPRYLTTNVQSRVCRIRDTFSFFLQAQRPNTSSVQGYYESFDLRDDSNPAFNTRFAHLVDLCMQSIDRTGTGLPVGVIATLQIKYYKV